VQCKNPVRRSSSQTTVSYTQVLVETNQSIQCNVTANVATTRPTTGNAGNVCSGTELSLGCGKHCAGRNMAGNSDGHTSDDKSTKTNYADVVSAIANVAMVFVTLSTVLYAARQLKQSLKVEKNRFLFDLRESAQKYNKIHVLLTDGYWSRGGAGPTSPDDWNMVRRYMGFIEQIQILLEDKLVTLDKIDHVFSHRVVAIDRNNSIRTKELEENKGAWKRFIELRDTLSKNNGPGWKAATKRAEAKT
jgi:hypothetical protein